MNSINWGNTIVYALGGTGAAFCLSLFIGLVLLLLVDYNESIVSLMKTSNWAMPIGGAIVGGVIGMVTREESRF